MEVDTAVTKVPYEAAENSKSEEKEVKEKETENAKPKEGTWARSLLKGEKVLSHTYLLATKKASKVKRKK